MGAASAEDQELFARSDVTDRQIVVPWWYYSITGVITGAAVVATALLPQQISGFFLVAAVLLVGVISRVTGRIVGKAWGTRLPFPTGAAGVGYLVALAVVVIGSLIVAWIVVRPSGPSWLAWMLAALVFVVTLSGRWVATTGRAA
ncbi:hypothetical protein ACN28C_26450 [Plantactinospora sp. WMMC1484]|uniref:hypothetical protein n=1 Tax=Plantactinospora sp. WMMC1484 TaxID=3404122 RepID=UPI003BF58CC6